MDLTRTSDPVKAPTRHRLRLHIELDPEVRSRLDDIARSHERSLSGEVRWLLGQYVEAPNDFQPW